MNGSPLLPDQHAVRDRFPALAGGTIFLENAGGSQVPADVAERMHLYLTQTYVQLGAGYALSRHCTRTVAEAHAFARTLVNAGDGQAVLGPSSTALLNMLAGCLAETLPPGRRIIVAENGHEANVGPWKRLARQGHELVWWPVDPADGACRLDDLRALLRDGAAVVALPHVSNLLGGIVDLRAVADLAHAAGAQVVADGVAYAPHRAVDVQAWDVDWYVFSAYKVYGPHMAVLYGRSEALRALPGPNHFFVTDDDLAYRFEPGGANHESCAGLLGLGAYLNFVAGRDADAACDRSAVEAAFARMAAWEQAPTARLLDHLAGCPDVRIVGPARPGPDRVGTVSFVHARKPSREIVAAVDRSDVAIRHGHMYAWHLCRALGLDLDDGVVRVSLVHYNTVAEIERLIAVLDDVL